MTAEWVAADWGTSRLRVWGMRGDAPVWQEASDRGMGTLEPHEFEGALRALLRDPALPVVACGMVGARQGWVEAPYAAVPHAPLGPAIRAPGALDIRILPGLSQAAPPDVMRGEETQIAGLLAEDPGFDGVACLPGTHTKWAMVSAGEVVSFRTAMTGELFALLSERSVLRHSVQADAHDEAAFAEALADALSRPEALAAGLFAIRAGSLLDGTPAAASRARLSGLLIGAELAALRPYWLGQEVAVIADGALSRAYGEALAAQGVSVRHLGAEALTLRGLAAARAKEPA
jgi:2-dehydro-3-deoxygalactonokinase